MIQQPSASAAKRAARLERRNVALALRPSLSPAGPAPEGLRLATWNLNSLRARLAALERFLDRVQPDILCVQETKAVQLSDQALTLLEARGYHAERASTPPSDHAALLADFYLDATRDADAGEDHIESVVSGRGG